jgi:hypothetical protein
MQTRTKLGLLSPVAGLRCVHTLLASAMLLGCLASTSGRADQGTAPAANATAAVFTVSGRGKLIGLPEIVASFTTGNTARVIVMLAPPPRAMGLSDYDSPVALGLWQATIKARQDSVLTRVTDGGGVIRHRFENIPGFSAEVSASGFQMLLDSAEVVSIEPVQILEQHLAQGIPLMGASAHRSTYNGSGVAIAICDTGIDTSHARLGGGGFPNAKVLGGYDFGDSDSNPRPNATSGNPHGTCCAGIAAGNLGTMGDYIGGVAYNAKLYALKISSGDTGSASSDAMVAAWDWCVTHKNDNAANPILVISTSFGGGRYTSSCDSALPSMTTAANAAVAAGITVLASSGNNGYCDAIGWPACISSVISVGAVYDAAFGRYYPCLSAESCAPKSPSSPGDNCYANGFPYYGNDATAADKVTSYANVASFLTLLAPANECSTTDIVGSGGYSTGDYATGFGGTSAACPYAAGAVACLQSAAKARTGSFLPVGVVRSKLIATGNNIADTKVAITKPRVNLASAIDTISTSVSLATALDWSGPVTTGGSASWFGQASVTHDGADAGQSGAIADSQVSYASVSVNGPGTISFWWKVSSESGWDYLRFYTNEVEVTAISGETSWAQASLAIGPGVHGLKWSYTKDGSASAGSDAGWVDQLAWAVCTAPVVTSLAISSGAASTTSQAVTLNNAGSGNPTHYMASESSTFSGASWLAYSTSPSFMLSAGVGTKTVYFKTKNACWESPVVWDTIDLVPVSATVTVTATDATAGEPASGQGTGTFTFTRTAPTTGALTVNYTVGGTATSGTDYTALGTSVTFAPGAASTNKLVSVLDDSLVEGDEQASVTLVAGSGYTLGSPAAATVTIRDDDTTLTVTAGAGGTTSPSGSVVVTQGVARAISATASNGYTFLNWSVTSGTATLANANLASTTVTLSAPATIRANFTASVPVIALAPTNLANTCAVGASAASQSLEVWNSGGGTLTYSLATNAAWLRVSPTSGTSSGEHDPITVSYASAGLAAGTYDGTITISAAGAGNTPRTVPVRLVVTPCGEASLVTGRTLGTLRNSYSGWVGMRLQVGASAVTVSQLGRVYVSGNTNAHALRLVDLVNKAVVAAATWTPVAGTSGQFQYVPVTPVVLVAGREYALASQEADGKDTWYDVNTTVTTTTAASVLSGAYSTDGTNFSSTGGAGQTYGPLDLKLGANCPAVVSVTASDATAGEPASGQGTGTFTFTRTAPTTGALTVNYTVGGTATSGTDYTALGTSVTFAPGAASTNKLVSVLDDSLVEGDEQASVTLVAGSGYTLGSPAAATVTIRDDDTTLTVTAGAGGTTSPSGSVVVTQGVARAISATASNGYTFLNWSVTSGTATLANANLASTTVTLSAPATIRANFTASVPVIALAPTNLANTCAVGASAASQSLEVWNSGGGTLTYSLATNAAWLRVSPTSGTSSGEHDPITVSYASAGLAAGTYDGTITISAAGAGNTPRTVPVRLVVTPCGEASLVTGRTLGTLRNSYSGWVGMRLQVGASAVTVSQLGRVYVSGNTNAHALRLVDLVNKAVVAAATWTPVAGTSGQFQYVPVTPVVLVAGREYALASQEADGKDTWYDVNTTVTTTTAASVLSGAYSTDGTNFSSTGGAGQTYGPLDLKLGANCPAVVSVTASDATAGEPASGQGTGTFTFTRTAPTTGALTVNYTVGGTATSGTDYTALGTSVTFAPGAASTNKLVSVLDDSLVEGDEQASVTLVAGSGYTLGSPAAATVTIRDDDTTLTVTAGAGGTTSPSGSVVVTQGVARAISATASNGYTFLNWSVTSGTATLANANLASTTVTLSAPATVRANFSSNIVAILTSASALSVPEGGTNALLVKLTASPLANVLVSVAHTAGDPDLTVQSGGTLTFTPATWNSWQRVTLAATEDADALNGSATITCTASGLPSVPVTATEIDNDLGGCPDYLGSDVASGGTWRPKYGTQGYLLVNHATNLPSGVTVTPAGVLAFTWSAHTTQAQALQRVSESDRIAACWYSSTGFTVDVTNVAPCRFGIYLLDWENTRAMRVEMRCRTSGALISSLVVSNFSEGRYLFWDLKGPVQLRCVALKGNAVLSGLFFDPPGTTIVPTLRPGALSLSFPTVVGRYYTLERSTSGLAGPWLPLMGAGGTGSPLQLTDYTGFAGQAFYRVRED